MKLLLYFYHSCKHAVDKWSTVCNPFSFVKNGSLHKNDELHRKD